MPDRPEIRGMIARVPHLVVVEQVAADPADATGKESNETA
jgi:hypothetical protein